MQISWVGRSTTWRGVVEVVKVKQFSSSTANGQFTWWSKIPFHISCFMFHICFISLLHICIHCLRRNIVGIFKTRQTFLLLSPFHHKTAPSSRNFSHFSSSLWKCTKCEKTEDLKTIRFWIPHWIFLWCTWTCCHWHHRFSGKEKLVRKIFLLIQNTKCKSVFTF